MTSRYVNSGRMPPTTFEICRKIKNSLSASASTTANLFRQVTGCLCYGGTAGRCLWTLPSLILALLCIDLIASVHANALSSPFTDKRVDIEALVDKVDWGRKSARSKSKTLSQRDERTVLKVASAGKHENKVIIPTTGLNVRKKIIYNIFTRSGDFQYKSKLYEISFTDQTQMQRSGFLLARNDLGRQFFDEKNWNLDVLVQ
ncbi:hypothetical protein AVEN_122328-1 [Araneus ventricosus]|uniref:Uncharacterized protein n=1 Tax=Araneus ventricosus TaxID=182803 RepID=A0A4Y2M272_ARAVE|nr:hypothetical protein AVEN_122328-1 [Araneus ventricosus]